MAFRLVTLYEAIARRLPTEEAFSTATPPDDEARRPIGFRAQRPTPSTTFVLVTRAQIARASRTGSMWWSRLAGDIGRPAPARRSALLG